MKRLLSLGGEHSHVAVLKSQGEAPMPDARLTLVGAKTSRGAWAWRVGVALEGLDRTALGHQLPTLVPDLIALQLFELQLSRRAARRYKKFGQRARRLPATLPTRGEEEESRETCVAA